MLHLVLACLTLFFEVFMKRRRASGKGFSRTSRPHPRNGIRVMARGGIRF